MTLGKDPSGVVETKRQVDLRLQLLDIRQRIIRARRILEEQRLRLRRLRTGGRPIKLHERLTRSFERSLADMHRYERMLEAELEDER